VRNEFSLLSSHTDDDPLCLDIGEQVAWCDD